MDFKVLAVGDVVGDPGLNRLTRSLRVLKRQTGADFVVVNGENCEGIGILPWQAEEIFNAGADCITLGNHTFHREQIVSYLDKESSRIIRPANFSTKRPGKGWAEFETKAGTVAVVNLIGICHLDDMVDKRNREAMAADIAHRREPVSPYWEALEDILKKTGAKIILVDFHADATSEKRAMGYAFDGRISALWGTHTHVPTADTCILPKGTGYVTDLGMTGPIHAVLGVPPEQSIARLHHNQNIKFRTAGGPTKLEAVLFTIDSTTGKCKSVERADLYE